MQAALHPFLVQQQLFEKVLGRFLQNDVFQRVCDLFDADQPDRSGVAFDVVQIAFEEGAEFRFVFGGMFVVEAEAYDRLLKLIEQEVVLLNEVDEKLRIEILADVVVLFGKCGRISGRVVGQRAVLTAVDEGLDERKHRDVVRPLQLVLKFEQLSLQNFVSCLPGCGKQTIEHLRYRGDSCFITGLNHHQEHCQLI